ncbi:MAG: hypothetical protein HGB05_21855 [Chloroflexi bacterium]|nr:hypothetical protein [Chloroflexota bacterium]
MKVLGYAVRTAMPIQEILNGRGFAAVGTVDLMRSTLKTTESGLIALHRIARGTVGTDDDELTRPGFGKGFLNLAADESYALNWIREDIVPAEWQVSGRNPPRGPYASDEAKVLQ